MFWGLRRYRKNLLMYGGIVLSLCVLFSAGLTYMILRGQMDGIGSAAETVFEQLERDLERRENEVELFVQQQIYGNPALLKDMQLLLESGTAEEYLSKRLDRMIQGDQLPSMAEAAIAFNTVSQPRTYRQISMQSQTHASIIEFQENGIRMSFRTRKTPLLSGSDEEGIVFARSLVDSNGNRIGEARFLLDPQQAFASLQYAQLPGAILCDTQGHAYDFQENPPLPDRLYQSIAAAENTRGTLQNDNGDPIYYTAFASETYGYRLLCTYGRTDLFRAAGNVLAVVYPGTFLVFLFVMTLIYLNMRHEGEFLLMMLDNIRRMETGHFEQMENRYGNKNEYGIIAGALNEMGGKLETHIRTEYLLKLKQQETEMIALQHQVNPHFLFNTLEIIRAGSVLGKDVGDAVASLGRMYRNMVSDQLEISMAQELDLLNAYLEIMEFRNQGSFFYQSLMDDAVKSLKTVKFWLQPIAENFFVHGYDKQSDFNLFVFSARELDAAYQVELVNNGKKMTEEKLSELRQLMQGDRKEGQEGSVGLKNVYARLRYYYGDRLSMTVENNQDAGLTVRVIIQKEAPPDGSAPGGCVRTNQGRGGESRGSCTDC